MRPSDEAAADARGWGQFNAHHWRTDYRDFVEWWAEKNFTEPHSTKQIEDAIGWGLDTDPETVIAFARGAGLTPTERKSQLDLASSLRCQVLVLRRLDELRHLTAPGSPRSPGAATDIEQAEPPAPAARSPWWSTSRFVSSSSR